MAASFQVAKGEGFPGSAISPASRRQRLQEDSWCLEGEAQGRAGREGPGRWTGQDFQEHLSYDGLPLRSLDGSFGTSREIGELLL